MLRKPGNHCSCDLLRKKKIMSFISSVLSEDIFKMNLFSIPWQKSLQKRFFYCLFFFFPGWGPFWVYRPSIKSVLCTMGHETTWVLGLSPTLPACHPALSALTTQPLLSPSDCPVLPPQGLCMCCCGEGPSPPLPCPLQCLACAVNE